MNMSCLCRYAFSRSMPTLDVDQHLLLKSAEQTDGVTSVFFSRRLDTGDTIEDISLAGRCLYVLWAWGSTITQVNLQGTVSQHTSRGTHGVVCFPDIGQCPGIENKLHTFISSVIDGFL